MLVELQVIILCLFTLHLLMPFTWSKTFNIDDEDSYVFEKTPKLIQQPSGSEVRLKCGIHNSNIDFMTSSSVFWDFKSCGENFNKTSCNEESLPWNPINCQGIPCKTTVLITNSSENDSGFYRCRMKPDQSTSLQIQIVRLYHLDIIPKDINIPPPPVLLDHLPANISAQLNSQVVFQCRVNSKVLPSIRWLKKHPDSTSSNRFNLENSKNNENFIQYFENSYTVLHSSGEKELSEDTYLSKLKLSNVSEKDNGFYACVVINYSGFKVREAYLNVIYPEIEQVEEEQNSKGTSDLLLLFLIPVGLAVFPVCIWICFILSKRSRRKKIQGDDGKNEYCEVNMNIL